MSNQNQPNEVSDLSEDTAILHLHIDNDGNPVVIVNVMAMWQLIFKDEDEGADTDPGMWGIILAQVTRHVASAHHKTFVTLCANGDIEGPPPPKEAILMRIEEVLIKELSDPRFAETLGGDMYFSGEKN